MKRRFKRKKYYKIKKIIIISILFIIILLFFKYNINNFNYKDNFVENILTDISNNRINKIINYVDKNMFNSPIYFLEKEVGDIKTNKQETNIFTYVNVDKPKIYIYNSHQGEEYSKEYLEDHNIIPNVLTASYMLKDKLNNLGINTIVEENDILKYMKENNLNHAGSYTASKYFLKKIINQYNSIELYIDLHRDSISHDLSYVNINNMDCAKILFVIGLENENYKNNLKVVERLNTIINTKYPNLSRGILKKQGYGVNGVYNQDLDSNVILIEIGGYQNNINEISNTLDMVAIAIKEYLNEKK